jgi:hypothetical protein
MNISGKLLGINLFLHQNRLESPLEKMPGSLSLRVEISGISTVNMMEDLGKISPGSLQKQMVMVRQKTIAVDYSPISFMRGLKIAQKSLPIRVVPENRLLLIPPRGYMIPCSQILNA